MTAHTAPQTRTCIECGTAYRAARKDAEFCSSPCRIAHSNRRSERGKMLYDVLMINFYDRKFRALLDAWTRSSRLCAHWRRQDKAEREGRRSWRNPTKVAESTAWAEATVVKGAG